MKRSIKKSIGRTCLSLDQLYTIITEVEAVINEQPLVYVGEEFTSGVVLTPADFLSLNTATAPPPHLNTEDNDPEYTDKTTSADKLLSSWKKDSHILTGFGRYGVMSTYCVLENTITKTIDL